MTSRERLLAVLHGQVPDSVPVDPDISNMVPCRLTGKPFWEIYLYQNPPLWKAHLDAVKFFDLDGGIELYTVPLDLDPPPTTSLETRIVGYHTAGAPVTQVFDTATGQWHDRVTIYWRDAPPVGGVDPKLIGMPPRPTTWEPVTGVKEWPTGLALWELVCAEMGDQGVVGAPSGCQTAIVACAAEVYAYFDDPTPFERRAEQMWQQVEQRLPRLAQLERRPDFLFCGASGSLIWQTPAIFERLVLPLLKRTTELARDLGFPTHVHSCGPETPLVRMAAEHTALTVIDPLEIPPMGDSNLAELKQLYGHRLVLKGNLHTTDVLLRGSVDDVVRESKAAIDAAGAGGGFILSTGDQCGRDTPDENLQAMVETARTYGRYR